MDNSVIERFAKESPTSMMLQGLMEHLLTQENLDSLFEHNAQVQYTRNLLFSQVVNLMTLVVCSIQPSVNAAYRRQAQELNVSRTALYDKLNGIEPQVSAALVRESSRQLSACIDYMEGSLPQWVEGYRVRIRERQLLGSHRPPFEGFASTRG